MKRCPVSTLKFTLCQSEGQTYSNEKQLTEESRGLATLVPCVGPRTTRAESALQVGTWAQGRQCSLSVRGSPSQAGWRVKWQPGSCP